jgi:hypothetical protein
MHGMMRIRRNNESICVTLLGRDLQGNQDASRESICTKARKKEREWVKGNKRRKKEREERKKGTNLLCFKISLETFRQNISTRNVIKIH